MVKLVAPFSYQGSKRRELTKIEEYEPKKFTTLVDVFGGGGSVSIHYLKKNKNVIYNDLFKGLYDIFCTLKSKVETEKLVKEMDSIDNTNLELFYKIFDRETELSEAARTLYLTKIAFRNMIHSRMPIKDKDKDGKLYLRIQNIKFKQLLLYNDLLSKDNFKTLNLNYKDIFEKYKNNENTFLYLDPPYVSRSNTEYGNEFTIADLETINNFMNDKNVKCKVMLNIDYTGYTRELFGNTFKHGYPIKYQMAKKNLDIYQKYHLIATNY